MRNKLSDLRLAIVVIALATTLLIHGTPHAAGASATNVQVCTSAPVGSVGLMGCITGNVVFQMPQPTSLVRSQVKGVQGWRAFNTLAPTDLVYAQDGQWHAVSTLGTGVPQQPPATTPPVTPPPAATAWVALNWSCSITHNVATCTATLPP